MDKPTLKKLGCYNEINDLSTKVSLFNYAFSPLNSYKSLIMEFLSSYTLHSTNFDKDNPYFSLHFKLGRKDQFMTSEEFDSLFGFYHEGHVQVKLNFSAFTFWKDIKAPQAPNFSTDHTKASHLKNKTL